MTKQDDPTVMEGSSVFTLGNCLVILYTVGLGVIVASVLVTAKDLENSLTEKQTVLDHLTEQHTQLRLNLDKSLAEARKTEGGLKDTISQLTAGGVELEVNLSKTQDELEVCNKNYQNDLGNLRQEMTETKTKMFESFSRVNELDGKNNELSGELINVQRRRDELKSQNDELSLQRSELNSVVSGLNQDKNSLDSEIQQLKLSLEEKEKSLKSSKIKQIEELENLKSSQISEVEALKAAQVESLAALQLEINSLQELIKSSDDQIIDLQNDFSEQEILFHETNRILSVTEQSLKDKTQIYEDLKETMTAKQDQLEGKENELKQLKISHQEEVDLFNKKLAEHERSSTESLQMNEALKQTITEKDDELKVKDSEKETSVKEFEQKMVDLTKLLTDQEKLNGELASEEENLKTQIENLGVELEKTRKDTGECLVKKTEEEALLHEQMKSLRIERDSAEQKLKEFDLKLDECKTN